MSGRGERDLRKEQFWRQQVRQWRRSGLTIRAFCQQHRLSESNFYAWRRTITEREPQAGCRLRCQGQPNPADAPATFVPVQVVAAPTAALEVLLGSGRVLRVPPGFDAVTLRQLLTVLEESSC